MGRKDRGKTVTGVEAVRVPPNPSGACQVWDCNKALRYQKKLHVRQRRPFTATHLNLDSVAEKRVAILRLFLLAHKRPALSKSSGGARHSTARSARSQSPRCSISSAAKTFLSSPLMGCSNQIFRSLCQVRLRHEASRPNRGAGSAAGAMPRTSSGRVCPLHGWQHGKLHRHKLGNEHELGY
jgi:hypothetical protein